MSLHRLALDYDVTVWQDPDSGTILIRASDRSQVDERDVDGASLGPRRLKVSVFAEELAHALDPGPLLDAKAAFLQHQLDRSRKER